MPRDKRRERADEIDIENLEEVEAYVKELEQSDSEDDAWLDKEADILAKFSDEFDKMDAARSKYTSDRDICDGQMEANTYYDDDGKLIVNPPLEQGLVELANGRMSGKMNYNLEPIGKKPVAQDSIVAKASLAHYINVEETHNKLKASRNEGAIYGTAVYFTGLIVNRDVMYEIKEDVDVDSKHILRATDYDEYEQYTYEFTGKNVPLREFRIDENAINQPDLQKAEKCVMKETMSLERFKIEYGDEEVFKGVDDINEGMSDVDPAYGEDKEITEEEVIIHKYFNKTTKDFRIIVNLQKVLFAGKMINKSGRLPFESKQHYTNHKCFYGYGICHKVRYLKAYKAELLQDLLDQSRQGGMNILAGNGANLDDDWFFNPGEINIMNFTGDIQNVKPFSYEPNIAKYQAVLAMLDDLVIQDTGENLKGTYTAVAEQLGTVEIIENSRMTRLATVDENDDLFLARILTASLDNITQYAYKMQTKTTKGEEGIETVEYPVIQVKGAKVEQDDDGNVTILYEHGEDGYFEFREEMIKGRYLVKVVTNSNINTQKTLERNSITQYVNNFVQMAQVSPDLVQEEDVKGVLDLMKMLYGYDDRFSTDTMRDKIKRENLEIIEQIQGSLGLLSNVGTQDVQNTIEQSSSLPNIPAGTPNPKQAIEGGELQVAGGMPNPGDSTGGALI